MADVSDATWRIATKAPIGECYHISTNDIVTIRQVVERICAKLGARFEDHVRIVGERLGKDAAYLLDSAKLRSELGWTDHVTLDRGIDECIAWVKANLKDLEKQPMQYVHKA